MPTFTNDLDGDAPLPNIYGGNLIRLQMQTPYRLYLYWYFTDLTLREELGEQADDYQPAVRIVNLGHGIEKTIEVSRKARDQWLDVLPGMTYRAEVGLYAPGQPFISLLTSREVSTPRVSVSLSECPHVQWLYDQGEIKKALETLFNSLELIGKREAIPAIVKELFSEEPVPSLELHERREMSDLLIALAMGQHHLDLQSEIRSDAVLNWLGDSVMGKVLLIPHARKLYEVLYSMLYAEFSQEKYRELEMAVTRRTYLSMGGASETHMSGSVTNRQWRKLSI